MNGKRWALFLTISLFFHALLLFTDFHLETVHLPAVEICPIKVSLVEHEGKKGSLKESKAKRILKRVVGKSRKLKRKAVKAAKKSVPKAIRKKTASKAEAGEPKPVKKLHGQHSRKPSLLSVSVIPPECTITKPSYPYVARLRRYQGRVLLRVLVDRDGRVSRVLVVKSSGHKVLDKAAVSAAKSWRCRPALSGGIRVPYWLEVPVVFRLSPP